MTKTKSFGVIAMSICLVLLTVFGFAACGGDDDKQPISIWGKSFAYQDQFTDSYTYRKGNSDTNEIGSLCGELIMEQFNDGNLELSEATFAGEAFDLSDATSAEDLMNKIYTKAKFEMSKLAKWTVTFSQQETSQITISAEGETDRVFVVTQNPNSNDERICSIKELGNEGTLGTFLAEATYSNDKYSMNFEFPYTVSDIRYEVKIPTMTIIDDLSAEVDRDLDNTITATYVTLEFYPLLSLVEGNSQA